MNALKEIKSAFPQAIKNRLRKLLPNFVWAYMRAYTEPLRLYQTDRFTFYPVSNDPPVIYTTSGETLGNVFYMAQALEEEKGKFIVAFHTHISNWKAHFLKRQIDKFERENGKCNLTILAPNKEEEKRISRVTGADARYINKNAFTREDQFRIQADADKVYDGIMNARMLRFKRVELARLIDNLAIITTVDNEDYFEEVQSILDESEWLNFQDGEYSYLSRKEVARALNTARTGLILSAVEGTNRASIEYLLCGLPVVSTPSKGGRNVFFHEDYCTIVEPTAEAVRRGVHRMIDQDTSPERIRERTLQHVREHRSRFLDLANELANRDLGIEVDDWLDRFPRDLKFRCDPKNFLSFLQSDYFEGKATEHTSAAALRRERPERWREITGDVGS